MFNPNEVATHCRLTEGQWADHYQVQKILGEGTFGVVYQVYDAHDRQLKALKMLKLWEVPVNVQSNLTKRFELEYETGKITSAHLVRMLSYGQLKGNPYLVMEFCPHGDLRKSIDDRIRLSVSDWVRTGQEIVYGLHDLHTNGKVHRDLKPENVLINQYSKACLTDFGIVGHANIQLTVTGFWGRPQEMFGTYAYMAPEQLNPKNRKETLLPTIDIFAFGVVMFELLTHQLPYGRLETEADLVSYRERAHKGYWEELSQLRPDVPADWQGLITGCLQPDRKKRIQSVEEVSQRLGVTRSNQVIASRNFSISNDIGTAGLHKTLILKVMQGEEFGRIYDLNELLNHRSYGILKLGRWNEDVSNHIPIVENDDCFISRAHATLEKQDAQWILRDGQWCKPMGNIADWYRSKNGTYLNHMEVTDDGHLLQVGDIITIGNTTLKVQWM